jgi:uncharacterized protein (DUF2132 family)
MAILCYNISMSNLLQNITLEKILEFLVAHYGWETLGADIKINCFITDPSIKSSLIFLRRTPWARSKVEELYIHTVDAIKNDHQ